LPRRVITISPSWDRSSSRRGSSDRTSRILSCFIGLTFDVTQSSVLCHMRAATQAFISAAPKCPTVIEPGFLRRWRRFGKWRRRADSNRCIKVLQTSPLATWVRRHAHQQQNLEFRIGRASRESRIFENVLDQSRRAASSPEFNSLAPSSLPWTTGILERETGFEPATSTLARLHSTTELFPLPLVLSEWILTKPKIGVKRF
jgi:hypothetical protein